MQFWSELLPELALVLVLVFEMVRVVVLDLLLEFLLVLELFDVAAAATFSTFVLPAVLLASATTGWAEWVGIVVSPKIQVHTPLSQPQKPPLLLLDVLGEAEADAPADAEPVAPAPAELLADEDALVFAAFATLPADEEEALGVPEVLEALGDAVVLDGLALDELADAAAL